MGGARIATMAPRHTVRSNRTFLFRVRGRVTFGHDFIRWLSHKTGAWWERGTQGNGEV
jgi:hypothetical protein